VRDGSFFSRSHLTLQQIIIYCWCRDNLQRKIAHEAGMLEDGHTIADWCNFCREVCEVDLEEHLMEIDGFDEFEQPKVVEIDESNFFHRKYNTEQWREGYWVLEAWKWAQENVFLWKYRTETQKHYLLSYNSNFFYAQVFLYELHNYFALKGILILFRFFQRSNLLFIVFIALFLINVTFLFPDLFCQGQLLCRMVGEHTTV
jgi:thiol-disulfide isomerase/thioredoxin